MSIPGRHEDRRLERLLADHYSAVVDRAERLNDGDPDAAEELAQEVFAQAGELLRRNHVASAWDAQEWLETTTLRLDHARNVERTGMVAAAEVREALADVAGARVDHALVRRALHDLDRREAIALRLHYVEGLPHSQIARRMRIPATDVARLLREGRAHLRDWYVALAEAAGRLVVVQWVFRRVRRLRGAFRLADGRLAASFRAEILPTFGAWGTTATNLTLATVVAIATSGSPHSGPADTRTLDRPTVSAVADTGAAATASSPSATDEQARVGARAPTSDVAQVKVSPAVVSETKPNETEYVVTPVDGQVSDRYSDDVVPGTPGFVSLPMRFECPPPERRPPGPAVGCPIIESVS